MKYTASLPKDAKGVSYNRFTYHGGALRDMGRTLLLDMASLKIDTTRYDSLA